MHTPSLKDLFKPLEGTEPKVLTLEGRRVRFATPPQEPETRLLLAGKPICTPGNLTTLIARAKVGKTAALGAAVSAIIQAHHDRSDADTFKFSAPYTEQAVVLIDTEQSPYDAWTCHSRTLTRALSADPEWLHHYALVGYSARQLREALPAILATASAQHNGIFTLILDGVADFVTSVNDEIECNEFISWLRTLTITHNCPAICVIHSNEGVKNGDDGRGWLGKELTRKAESNLLLKKEGDITTITSEKQRKAPITVSDGVAFRWDEESAKHVSAKAVVHQAPGGRPKAHHYETFAVLFPKGVAAAQGFRPLHRAAKEIRPSIGVGAFEKIIAEGHELGLIQTDLTNPKQPRYYAV